MRANQLWRWIYNRGATSFDVMSDIAKDVRPLLDQHFTLARPEVVLEQVSSDGTRKWLLRLAP
jgi:23S rRNA (adenine2503-C2)-methyltransferase